MNGGLTSLSQFHRALASTVFHREQMQQWVEHGLVSGVLLRLLRVLQDRTDARQLAQEVGLARRWLMSALLS